MVQSFLDIFTFLDLFFSLGITRRQINVPFQTRVDLSLNKVRVFIVVSVGLVELMANQKDLEEYLN